VSTGKGRGAEAVGSIAFSVEFKAIDILTKATMVVFAALELDVVGVLPDAVVAANGA
jgi:hypothetical protein